MSCFECDSERVEILFEAGDLQERKCLECGLEFTVHVNRGFTVEQIGPVMRRFRASYTLVQAQNALKSYLTIKRLLTGCERFAPAQLERQFRCGQVVWDIGEVFIHERERIEFACAKHGITFDFTEINNDCLRIL